MLSLFLGDASVSMVMRVHKHCRRGRSITSWLTPSTIRSGEKRISANLSKSQTQPPDDNDRKQPGCPYQREAAAQRVVPQGKGDSRQNGGRILALLNLSDPAL